MKIEKTSLPGVIILEPSIYGDSRGFFLETYREDLLYENNINKRFVQDNHSRSKKGVLRGLHYQLQQPQGKLVRVARGKVYDVAVDVRLGSPTFAYWFGAILDDSSLRMMYIPPGFAHGFVVLSEVADFIYKCTDYYHPQSEQGILWNDPEIGIEWPLMDVSVSEKDRKNKVLSSMGKDLLPRYDEFI
jgi:dTDP-4-dehydrorhamnose 3,5-epimerase